MKRIALAVALAAGVAVSYSSRPAASALGDTDKAFVHDMALANMAEIELGQLALEFGASAAVKDFGRMMVDHHTDAGDKLLDVAHKSDIVTPSELDEKHRDLRDTLSKLRGSAFDKKYMEAMIAGHEELLDRLESRVDDASRAGWKIRMEDAKEGRTAGFHDVATVAPEYSTNPITMGINQWAAGLYPVAWRHQRSAKAIFDELKRDPARTE